MSHAHRTGLALLATIAGMFQIASLGDYLLHPSLMTAGLAELLVLVAAVPWSPRTPRPPGWPSLTATLARKNTLGGRRTVRGLAYRIRHRSP